MMSEFSDILFIFVLIAALIVFLGYRLKQYYFINDIGLSEIFIRHGIRAITKVVIINTRSTPLSREAWLLIANSLKDMSSRNSVLPLQVMRHHLEIRITQRLNTASPGSSDYLIALVAMGFIHHWDSEMKSSIMQYHTDSDIRVRLMHLYRVITSGV